MLAAREDAAAEVAVFDELVDIGLSFGRWSTLHITTIVYEVSVDVTRENLLSFYISLLEKTEIIYHTLSFYL